MKTLADNLYFKNLDNNTCVFHRLIDATEEEENKEVILAYYFLLKSDNIDLHYPNSWIGRFLINPLEAKLSERSKASRQA